MGEIIDIQDFRRRKAWQKVIDDERSSKLKLRVEASHMTEAQQAELYQSMSRHPAGKSRHE